MIAAFFRNIGYADQLGFGVRNLFKYSKYYSGQEPQFVEGDVFRIIVPLDETYSFDFCQTSGVKAENADKVPINNVSTQQEKIMKFITNNGKITSRQVEALLEVKQRRARIILGEMVDLNLLERQGAYRSTSYVRKNRDK